MTVSLSSSRCTVTAALSRGFEARQARLVHLSKLRVLEQPKKQLSPAEVAR